MASYISVRNDDGTTVATAVPLTNSASDALLGNGAFGPVAQTGAAAPATTGTMSVSMTNDIITITPTGACTFNASGGRTGRFVTFVVSTSGTSSYTLTFGTNFKSVGTLATGTANNKTFTVTFRCTNGTQWVETSRTTAM